MGDRLRRLLRRLTEILFQAALPGLIIYAVLLISFVVRGTPHGAEFSPEVYLRLLMIAYLTALGVTLLIKLRELRRAAVRADERLIGNAFGGWSKRDRTFCDAMTLLTADEAHDALEMFLLIQDEYEMTEEEQAVLSFYIGRCYQLLGCPSNAVPFYEKAYKGGFPREYAKLFQARSYADGGDYDRSYEVFCDLLEHDPPKDFYFLYTDIGFLFLRQRKPDDAIKWFTEAMNRHQNYAFALSGMAIASLQKGDFTAARDYRYKALINQLKDPSAFRSYFDETKSLMLEEHPEWAEAEKESASNPEEPTQQQSPPEEEGA